MNYCTKIASLALCICCVFAAIQLNAQPRIGGEIIYFETTTTLQVIVRIKAVNGPDYDLGPSTLIFKYNPADVSLSVNPASGPDYVYSADFGTPYINTLTRPTVDEAWVNVFISGATGTTIDRDLTTLVKINFEIVDPARFSLADFDFTWIRCEHSDTGFTFAIDDCTGFGDVALPVELSSFTSELTDRTIALDWTTVSEKDNSGFGVEYSYESGPFVEAGFVEGSGTTAEAQDYSYSIKDLLPGNYQLRLKQVDFDGKHSYSTVLDVLVGIPGEYLLDDAYPNPFNPQTTVNFAVRESQDVRYELYDSTGRLVRTLFTGRAESGKTESILIDGSQLTSGVYLGMLKGESFEATQRLILVK